MDHKRHRRKEKTREGKRRQRETREGKRRREKTREDKRREEKTREDKMRQEKTREKRSNEKQKKHRETQVALSVRLLLRFQGAAGGGAQVQGECRERASQPALGPPPPKAIS